MHTDGKPLWSELDWHVSYIQLAYKDKVAKYKKHKLLESLLDTQKDNKRRKILTIDAMKKKSFDPSCISKELKIRCILASFYEIENSGVATKVYQKSLMLSTAQLNFVINIHCHKIVKNDTLCIDKCGTMIQNYQKRRLKWQGHIMRLSDDTPAKLLLKEYQRPVKNKRGNSKTAWFKITT